MTEVNKKSNRRTLILLLVVFVLPVILAKLALNGDWFNKASTNQGELMDPILDFSIIHNEREAKWHLLFIAGDNCLSECELAIYSLNQVWIALGKNQDRVIPVVVGLDGFKEEQINSMIDVKSFKIVLSSKNIVDQVFKNQATDGIFIVDALGNIILRYPLHKEKQQAVLKSRDILADMRKLLKLSRIG